MEQKVCPQCNAILNADVMVCNVCGFQYPTDGSVNPIKRKISKAVKHGNEPLRPVDTPPTQNPVTPPVVPPPVPPTPTPPPPPVNVVPPTPQVVKENTKQCPQCKKMIEANAAFCYQCGYKFESSVTPNIVSQNPVNQTPPPPPSVVVPPATVENKVEDVKTDSPKVETPPTPVTTPSAQPFYIDQPAKKSNKTLIFILGGVLLLVLIALLVVFVVLPKMKHKPVNIVSVPVTNYYVCSSMGVDGKQMHAVVSNIISTSKAGNNREGVTNAFNKVIKTNYPKNFYIFKSAYCQSFKSVNEASNNLKKTMDDYIKKKYTVKLVKVDY